MGQTLLLKAAFLALATSWVLDRTLFPRAGYILFAGCLLVSLAFAARQAPRMISTYLVVIGIAFGFQAVFLGLNWSVALLAMSAYFAIPLLAGWVPLDYRRLLEVMGVFKLITVIYFFGLLLQLAGVESELLVVTLTRTFGDAHPRYTSFSGGPLLLGMFSFLGLVVCLADYGEAKSLSRKWWLFSIMAMALVNLYFSYARRYYVIAFLAGAFFVWSTRARNRALVYVVLPSSIVGLAVMAAALDLPIFARFSSILDFEEEGGNQLRFLLWLRALDFIGESPVLGLGVGSEGTVGQSEEAVQERLQDGAIAEMYYLKVGVEFGAIVAVFFAAWMAFLTFFSMQERTKGMFLYRVIPILGAVECIMGGALGSPFFAFPFWLVVAQMLRQRQSVAYRRYDKSRIPTVGAAAAYTPQSRLI